MREPEQSAPPVYTQSSVCDSNSAKSITRIAPSPTGALHLGNVRTFFINWALARKHGWDIVLRIEDLDTPRVKPGVIDQTIETLAWIGLDWDSGPIIQSNDLPNHHAAMVQLASSRRVYPCSLSRTQIQLASNAPNEGDHEIRFDPALRPSEIPHAFTDKQTNWRFVVTDDPIHFEDRFLGSQSFCPAHTVGDFVVWTQRRCPSYQLAVVVDDHHQSITQIIRGNDLLDSTARQIQLWDALDFGPLPHYTHLPLVRGADGRRLAKRHGDTRIEHYRSKGTSREHIIGLIAYWSGISSTRQPISPSEFLDAFNLDTLPKDDVIFTKEDDQWLTN